MTFSMVARSPKTPALGVVVATALPAVGSCVPHLEEDVGAVATQAQTSMFYGIEGLKLLRTSLSPQTALDNMLSKDREREKRQVIMIDAKGRKAAFTGKETVEWKGHFIGNDFVVAGNMLAGSRVIEDMAQAFEAHKGNLAERLLKALEAGQNAGGDKRGHMSAAIRVSDRRWKSESRPYIDLRVDAHPDPVQELHRIYTLFMSYFSGI